MDSQMVQPPAIKSNSSVGVKASAWDVKLDDMRPPVVDDDDDMRPPEPIKQVDHFDNIPAELTELKQWVNWDAAKKPYDPKTGKAASVTDANTWGTFAQAVKAYKGSNGKIIGIGFVFTKNDPYCGIDLDDIAKFKGFAGLIRRRINSYTEFSPSGKGYHIIAKAEKPGNLCKVKMRIGGAVEMYDHGRYFTITGNIVQGSPRTVNEAQAEVDRLYFNTLQNPAWGKSGQAQTLKGNTPAARALPDAEVLARAREAKSKEKFAALYDDGDWEGQGYPSPSEADQALCNLLVAAGAADEDQVDRLFRDGQLMRRKWERNASARHKTIAKALGSARSTITKSFAPGHVPKTFSARELMVTNFAAPTWAVNNLIPEGLTVLGGKPKMGKSWMALGLGNAVATGQDALGSFSCDQGSALYLALEDSPRRLKNRLGKMLDGQPGPLKLHIETKWDRVGEGGLEALEAWLEQHPDTQLVLVDTFARFRAHRAGNQENSYAQDYADACVLKAFADKHHIALVLIHHLRKAGADDFVDTLSGTTGVAGAADTILVLRRKRGQTQATLHVTGRDVEEQDFTVDLDPVTMNWLSSGAAPTGVVVSAARQAALDALTAVGKPMTAKQLAAVLEKTPNAAQLLLTKMETEDLVEHVGQKHAAGGGYLLCSTVGV